MPAHSIITSNDIDCIQYDGRIVSRYILLSIPSVSPLHITMGAATAAATSAPYSWRTSDKENSNAVPGPLLVVSMPSSTTRLSTKLQPSRTDQISSKLICPQGKKLDRAPLVCELADKAWMTGCFLPFQQALGLKEHSRRCADCCAQRQWGSGDWL